MVSSIARSALLGASLLLVGLALCADAAPHRPTVRDITRGWKPSAAKAGVASVSTAQQEGYEGYNGGDSSYGSHGSSAGYYAAVEEKEVCLVESMRRNCEYLDEFDGAYIHGEYSSELTLCSAKQASYNTNSGVGFGGVGTQQPLSAMGNCDWQIDYGFGTDITDNIYRVGGVHATCYFNGNGDESDAGPLSNRVVFGLQGTLYIAWEALSYQGGPAYNYDIYTSCDYGIFGNVYNRVAARNGSAGNADTAAGNSTVAQPTPAAGGATRRQRPAKAERPQHVPRTRNGVQRPTGKPARPGSAEVAQVNAGLQYHGKDSSHTFSTDKPVYYGEAYVMNGIIFGLAGQVKKEWQSGGTFEFTVDFFAYGLSNDWVDNGSTGVQAGLPWVTDKEYKLTFFKYPDYYPSSQK